MNSIRLPAAPEGKARWALAMAQRGFLVFPVRENAKFPPLVEGWPDKATTDADQIRSWWARWPNANIGVHCRDHIVIDVDVKNGKEGLASLEALDIDLNTLTVCTPTGGMHIYYSGPNVKNTVEKIAPGLDIRSSRGYVLGPGSEIEGRLYAVKNIAGGRVAGVPEKLATLLRTIEIPRRAEAEKMAPIANAIVATDTTAQLDRAIAYLVGAPAAIEGQGGDALTFKTACILKDFGVGECQAWELMADHWNPRCQPPWDEEELETKVRNAYRYGALPPGVNTPEFQFAGIDIPPPTPINRKQRLRYLTDSDALLIPDWLIRGLVCRRGVVLIGGQSRVGKSFLAIELAGCLSTGQKFFGRDVQEKVGVLYLAAEAADTLGPRLEALRRHRLANMTASGLAIAWCALEDVQDLDSLVEMAKADFLKRFGIRLGTVIIDTVAAAFEVADENDPGQATKVMKRLGRLSTDHDVLVVPVVHFGKDAAAGVRGSSGWTASADVIIAATGNISEITGEVAVRRLSLTKSRSAETGPIGGFDLRSVHIGNDDDGAPLFSAVIGPRIPKDAATYLEELQILAEPSQPVNYGRLREAVYARWPDKSSGARQKAFKRAEAEVVEQGLVRLEGHGGCRKAYDLTGHFTQELDVRPVEDAT